MIWRRREAVFIVTIGLGAVAVAETPSGEERRRVIEEVVVTAQKTAQSLQDVPISLSAVDGQFMRDVNAGSLQDIAAYIPNLQFSNQTDPALSQINIRGFGSNPLNASFESSVGFVQDEIFYGRQAYVTEAMFDIERVEVLRGPQGTLFGKNTVAGVFNVITAAPTEEFSGGLNLSHGSPGERRLEAAVGGGFAEWGGIRVSVLDTERAGRLRNGFLDRKDDKQRQQAQRLKLQFRPTDALTVDLMATNSETRINYWELQLFNLNDDTQAFLRNFDPAIENDGLNFQSSYNTPGFLDKGSTTFSLQTSWDIGDIGPFQGLSAVLVAGQSELFIDSLVDLDTSPADISDLAVASDYEQRSLELRFSGSSNGVFGIGESLEFVLGAFYFNSRFEQQATIAVGEDFGSYLLTDDALRLISRDVDGGSGGLLGLLNLAGNPLIGGLISEAIGEDFYRLDYLLDVEARALFAQATWHLSQRWALTPGIRFNREEKTVDASGRGSCERKPQGQPCVMETALSAEDYNRSRLKLIDTDVSPKLSLQYFWSEDLSLFATYARGFKSGGFNAASFTGEDLEFEPEEASTVELGAKGVFFERTLRLNAVLFETRFDNLQVLAFNGVFFDVTNAARATSRGLEMDFEWLTPFEPLSISGSLGLLDARYDRYEDAPAPIAQGVNETQDLSGRRIAFAPRQSASLTPTLALPVFGLGLRASIDVLFQGDQFTDTDLDPNTFVPAHTLLGARVSLGDPHGAWAITAGGSNLADKRVHSQVVDTVFFPGAFNSRQKPGRNWFVALSLQW